MHWAGGHASVKQHGSQYVHVHQRMTRSPQLGSQELGSRSGGRNSTDTRTGIDPAYIGGDYVETVYFMGWYGGQRAPVATVLFRYSMRVYPPSHLNPLCASDSNVWIRINSCVLQTSTTKHSGHERSCFF